MLEMLMKLLLVQIAPPLASVAELPVKRFSFRSRLSVLVMAPPMSATFPSKAERSMSMWPVFAAIAPLVGAELSRKCDPVIVPSMPRPPASSLPWLPPARAGPVSGQIVFCWIVRIVRIVWIVWRGVSWCSWPGKMIVSIFRVTVW